METNKIVSSRIEKHQIIHQAKKNYLEKRPNITAGRNTDNVQALGKVTGEPNHPRQVFKGTVRYFSEDTGQGFICENTSHKNYFVYGMGLDEKIRTNDQVSFELTKTPSGIKVIHVRKNKNL